MLPRRKKERALSGQLYISRSYDLAGAMESSIPYWVELIVGVLLVARTTRIVTWLGKRSDFGLPRAEKG